MKTLIISIVLGVSAISAILIISLFGPITPETKIVIPIGIRHDSEIDFLKTNDMEYVLPNGSNVELGRAYIIDTKKDWFSGLEITAIVPVN